MVKLTDKITKDISKNLMIEISDAEAKLISALITNSIVKIEKIKEFDFKQIEPMDYPNIPIPNDFREDEVKDFDNKEKLLELSGELENGYVKV